MRISRWLLNKPSALPHRLQGWRQHSKMPSNPGLSSSQWHKPDRSQSLRSSTTPLLLAQEGALFTPPPPTPAPRRGPEVRGAQEPGTVKAGEPCPLTARSIITISRYSSALSSQRVLAASYRSAQLSILRQSMQTHHRVYSSVQGGWGGETLMLNIHLGSGARSFWKLERTTLSRPRVSSSTWPPDVPSSPVEPRSAHWNPFLHQLLPSPSLGLLDILITLPRRSNSKCSTDRFLQL